MNRVTAALSMLFYKASAAANKIALHTVGRPVWTPREYAKFAEEGYQKNVIVYRCVSMVARAGASVPWVLKSKKAELDEHPLLTLLRRPNILPGAPSLVEAALAYYLLSGQSYLEAVGPDNQPPTELNTLRPDRMRVIPSIVGTPLGYEYNVNGQKVSWPADPLTGKSPILHLRTFNPLNDFYGMGPIEAAAYAIDQHNAAGALNQALLQNGARPSGAMTYEGKDGPASLTEAQYIRLKAEIDEQHGGQNRGRPMLLDGGLKWQEMGLSPRDMDWLKGTESNARNIAGAFSVPAQLLGIPGDNTFNNVREARQALYEDAVLPLLRTFTDALNRWLVPMFGEGLTLEQDLDEVPALAPKREAKWLAVQNATWLTTNEKREAVGYDKLKEPEADQVLVAAGLLPLGAGAGEGAGAPGGDPAADPAAAGEPGALPADPAARKPGAPVDGTAPPAGGAGKAPVTAANGPNGAQVTALREIVQAVADGVLPAASATAMVMFAFGVNAEVANGMISPADGFEPADDGEDQLQDDLEEEGVDKDKARKVARQAYGRKS